MSEDNGIMAQGGNGADSFALAHISDLHLGPLPFFSPRHWNLKRGLGYLNWHRRRRRVHRAEVASLMVEDIKASGADHVAVTGDLVNIALPSEFQVAARWLAGLGQREFVSVVPGNHDIYSGAPDAQGIGLWADYMRGDGDALEGAAASFDATAIDASFPYVRRRGAIALVGVNSAEPTPPFVAAGRVCERALERLGDVLDALGEEGLFRCVLIHHPPLPGQAPPRRALKNAAAVTRTLERHGAELVLHGHNHRNAVTWGGEGEGRFPVVGISSGSAARVLGEEPLARYNLIRIARRGGGDDADNAARPGWRIEITSRGLADASGQVVPLERKVLETGRPARPAARPAHTEEHA